MIITAASAACMISSCSLFSPKGTTVSGASATQVSQSSGKNDSTNQGKQSESQTSNKSNTSNKAKSANDYSDKIAGEWTIVSVGGKSLRTVDEMPYVSFEKSSGRFYASNGCNVINGSYKINGDGSLKLDNVLSTMKLCHDVQFEEEIGSALSGAETLNVKIDNIGHETFLRFMNSKGKELMSARKHNMDFLNGNWQIKSVAGKTINDEEANVFIDINELKIHGNTGCNYFNGKVYINPDKSNAIDFSEMATTRMACPNMEQESAILIALEETCTAIQGNAGQVMLLNQAGKELMTLESIPAEKQ